MDRLQSMRVFQRVVDEGGFAAAARVMDLSPAVVTRLVADLEEDLGTRLLHRTTRRLALTQAGEAYLGRLRPILQDIDEANALASSNTKDIAGVLRIAASPALATHVLAPLTAGFRARYPKVLLEVEVDSADQPAIEDHDVTLLSADAGFDADLVVRKVIEADAILVASPEYVARRGAVLLPHDLPAHDYLQLMRSGVRPGSLRMWPDGRPDELLEIDVRPVLWANHGDTLVRAALDGAGITTAAVDLVAPYLTRGELVRVLHPWITGHLTIYAAMPSRKFIPERTRRFVEYLVEQTRQHVAAAMAACDACRWEAPPAVAGNALSKATDRAEVDFVTAPELRKAMKGRNTPLLLDLRTHAAMASTGLVEGALIADLEHVLDSVIDRPADLPIVTLCACRQDAGAIQAARELMRAGFRSVRVLEGGFDAWRASDGRAA